MLFEYPERAYFGRVLPKSKIYQHARVSARLRRKFIDQIERITWAYKLAEETVNLRPVDTVPEIEVFVVELKGDEISQDVIRCIDNAIPFPVIYEIQKGDKVKVMAAYKRPSDADSNKWVTDVYFESEWQSSSIERETLPIALDLGVLYEEILRRLMPVSRVDAEPIKDQVQRLTEIRRLESQAAKLESRMHREKQFNRKVELNAELRKLKTQVRELTTDGHR